MEKEEFINEIERITELYLDSENEVPKLEKLYDIITAQAIAEHETKQWKKYPENKPGTVHKLWLVTLPDKSVHSCFDISFDQLHVIAFRELPEPYRKEPQP